jgi:hypothetical protein
MKKVLLIFPDTTSMADFIIRYRIGNAECNSIECSLLTMLTEREIMIATQNFQAYVQDHGSILIMEEMNDEPSLIFEHNRYNSSLFSSPPKTYVN